MADDALISAAEVHERVAASDGRLLVVGKGEPPPALPPGTAFMEARAFRDVATRDVASPVAMERLCARHGLAVGAPVFLADADGGPHAALALWTLSLYGHAPLALVDGRVPEGSPAAASLVSGHRPVSGGIAPEPRFASFRATRADVGRCLDDRSAALLDVRSPAEFAGVLTAPADAPQQGILRGGRLPGALNVPWRQALRPDGCFRSRDELAALYRDRYGLNPAAPVVVYARAAARACHTWFVLARVLGFEDVRVYDGGWAEWGNLVAVPVARG